MEQVFSENYQHYFVSDLYQVGALIAVYPCCHYFRILLVELVEVVTSTTVEVAVEVLLFTLVRADTIIMVQVNHRVL